MGGIFFFTFARRWLLRGGLGGRTLRNREVGRLSRGSLSAKSPSSSLGPRFRPLEGRWLRGPACSGSALGCLRWGLGLGAPRDWQGSVGRVSVEPSPCLGYLPKGLVGHRANHWSNFQDCPPRALLAQLVSG
jgi:hypothetical protein